MIALSIGYATSIFAFGLAREKVVEMKLLFVSRSLPFHRMGGMELVAWDLATELSRQGHAVQILTTPAPGLVADSFREGVDIRVLNTRSGAYSRRWWSESAAHYLRYYAQNVDLVLGIGGGAHSIVKANRQSGSKVPILIQSHGSPWGEIKSKLSDRSLRGVVGALKNFYYLSRDWRLSYYRQIVAIGPAVAQGLSTAPMRYLVREAPISTIENGINSVRFKFDEADRTEIRSILDVTDSTKVVISVSRMITQKGIRESLVGYARFAGGHPDSMLLLVGEGNDASQFESLARDLGIADRVRFWGPASRSQLPKILSGADVFLFTTLRQEGLAIAPLEAAANGLPLVLSDHILPDGIAAIPVVPRDPTSVANGILRGLAQGRNSAASENLPSKYTLSNSARRYVELFKEVLSH